MTFAELKAIVLAQFQEFFSLEWEKDENVALENSVTTRAYDIENIFYLGTSLPTDTYTLLYDQALIPFESVFFDYLYNKQSLIDILNWEAPQEKVSDFFDVAFEKLFDIPVDIGAEQTLIIAKQESESGVESFSQIENESDRFFDRFTNRGVISIGRELSEESTDTTLSPPAPITTVVPPPPTTEVIPGPTVFGVDNATDIVDGNYSAGQLSLREAILLANMNAGPSVISFGSGINNITMSAGEIEVNNNITIDGGGNTTIQA